ncbi:PREDICTED: CCG-binding protein 1 [Ipomoea nil]|uniref:CCG-binding protein 1 n=1 Tax=Ipomoea nil TaxID=35883 RepID=UPI000901BED6|nr:PREDICTED: CCG-binding protein 1 [Ipomoea nil]
MLRSVSLKPHLPFSSSSALLFEAANKSHGSGSAVNPLTIRCSSRTNGSIPKLEPFSRSKLERVVKDPPLIEKCERELADYCSVLEGDDSYSCWRAYFELKDLEKEHPKEEVERLILQAGGVKSLIGCVHGIASMQKPAKNLQEPAKAKNSDKVDEERVCPVPDGLPKSREEVEEEERALMPDSPFTRLLRIKGKSPAWYSQAPDHQTY